METRKCETCGKDKPLTEFHRNKSKPKGRHYVCKDCRKEERNRKHGKAAEAQKRYHMQTDEAFRIYYKDDDLKARIIECAAKHSRRYEVQQDMEAMAWGMIAMCETGKTVEYYFSVAERTIKNEYRKLHYRRELHLSDEELLTAFDCAMWTRGVW